MSTEANIRSEIANLEAKRDRIDRRIDSLRARLPKPKPKKGKKK